MISWRTWRRSRDLPIVSRYRLPWVLSLAHGTAAGWPECGSTCATQRCGAHGGSEAFLSSRDSLSCNLRGLPRPPRVAQACGWDPILSNDEGWEVVLPRFLPEPQPNSISGARVDSDQYENHGALTLHGTMWVFVPASQTRAPLSLRWESRASGQSEEKLY